MGTVIFDFDSTIVSVETLEEIIPSKAEQLHELTLQGMDGSIPFSQALEKRLSLLQPTRHEVEACAAKANDWLTAGMEQLFRALEERQHEVWIVSGGLLPILQAVGEPLGVARERICGVTLRWDKAGTYIGIDQENHFCQSKVAGIAQRGCGWSRPAVIVGDGMTDQAIAAEGFADHFIAFTQHAVRPPVLATTPYHAATTDELYHLLEELLNES